MGTDFLFARPSFLGGMATLFDFSGALTMYNYSRNGGEADARAIYEDWKALGGDVRAAMESLHPERLQARAS